MGYVRRVKVQALHATLALNEIDDAKGRLAEILLLQPANDIHGQGYSKSILGAAQKRIEGNREEAERLFLEAHQTFSKEFTSPNAIVKDFYYMGLENIERLVDLYESWERPADVDHWKKELKRIKARIGRES